MVERVRKEGEYRPPRDIFSVQYVMTFRVFEDEGGEPRIAPKVTKTCTEIELPPDKFSDEGQLEIEATLNELMQHFPEKAVDLFCRMLNVDILLLDKSFSTAERRQIRNKIKAKLATEAKKEVTDLSPFQAGRPSKSETMECDPDKALRDLIADGLRGYRSLRSAGRRGEIAPKTLAMEMYPEHRDAYGKLMRSLRDCGLTFEKFLEEIQSRI